MGQDGEEKMPKETLTFLREEEKTLLMTLNKIMHVKPLASTWHKLDAE